MYNSGLCNSQGGFEAILTDVLFYIPTHIYVFLCIYSMCACLLPVCLPVVCSSRVSAVFQVIPKCVSEFLCRALSS